VVGLAVPPHAVLRALEVEVWMLEAVVEVVKEDEVREVEEVGPELDDVDD